MSTVPLSVNDDEDENILSSSSSSKVISTAVLPVNATISKKNEDQSLYNIVIIIILIISFIFMVVFTYLKNKMGNIHEIINEAVNSSEYSPTVFLIYDKSSSNNCNRLIQILPFDWYVWAIQGELYILNAEGIYSCPPDNTASIRVFEDQFVETCLGINYDNLLQTYKRLPYVSVPYEITSTTFTIFSALNILVKKYVTFYGVIQNNAFIQLHHDNQEVRHTKLYDSLQHKKHVKLEKEHVLRKTATHKRNIAIDELTKAIHVHHSRLHEQTHSSSSEWLTERSVIQI
ncbi:unknown [Gryllus bimaculatus nudivirus]|uniref:Uncharacterized protein n=1 Tax=Gryllus bimaculatus nudivirus TaxID=432587 RepID=A4L250_9VIRU|nr:hypothetical protein GrBNV_gp87 [Gryllus bimaculatus nudivirus]ABO45420.1 unknown [Gryllus bimaculatus nudivirus]